MLSNAPSLNVWSSTEGGELVVGQSGTNSFPSSPLPFNNAYTPSPPWDPSAIPADQFASGSNRASIANEATRKPLQLKLHPVPASRTRSSIITNNKSTPGLERRGPPCGNALSSLNNNACHQGGPILPDGNYCWGSVEEHTFSHTATDAPLSSIPIISGRYAAVASNREYAPGIYEESSPLPYASSNNLPRDRLADGVHASGTIPSIQVTPPSQSFEGIDANEVVGENSPSANPPYPVARRSGPGMINTGSIGNNQDHLTQASEIASQRTAPPLTTSGSNRVASPQHEANTLKPDEVDTEFVVAVEPLENVSETDVWIKHWHEGIWGDDGYIYQLPPPILGYRPASRLHDLRWRGSQQHYLL
ncbi:hypothetical protein NUW54_g9588 [Trametes sanguinea]|uniref:Uncharacterized protein n=1 Tax=Trametes sanguinea TaxID=158606 RepID=A0ACC1P4S3_9APHY|nr:hypothetical protein NUW54_g9588 [Trametes sanguinea]